MAEMPIMPIYTDALLSDTGDLPNALFGAYVRLLMQWWRDGAMPEENERKLARWARMTTADFEDLKEFLTKTEKGWIQKKLFRTYAAQIEKSLKATNSANARHGRAIAQEELSERIATQYALRMLSMNHEPTSGLANANPSEKIKNKKKGSRGRARGQSKPLAIALPDEPEARRLAERIAEAIGHPAYASWFQTPEGVSRIEKNCSGFIVRASGLTADRISTQYRNALDDVAGKGNWRIECAA